jgi:hypothetical protein
MKRRAAIYRGTPRYIGFILAVFSVAACSTQTATSQSNDDSPSLTSPRTPRHTDKSDRPQVNFDPCIDIPDSALIEAGYDPASEENADFTSDEYTFLGCTYDTPKRRYGMNILSGNVSFAEEEAKVAPHASPIEINGRRALLEFNPSERDVCAVTIETSSGFLILDRNIFLDQVGPSPESEWCAGLEDTARIFERYIPKEG